MMRLGSSTLATLAGFICLALSLATAADMPTTAVASGVTLGNASLELRFVREHGRLRLSGLLNKLSGRMLPVTEDDFRIEVNGRAPLRAADFHYVRDFFEKIPGGPRLRLQLASPANGLGLQVTYELGDHDFFARRWLELTTAHPLPIRRVAVWQVGVPGTCAAQEDGPPIYLTGDVWKVKGKKGFGLPVFLEDTFWGLECPTGYNHYQHGLLTLLHYPGCTVTNLFVSQTAVVGVAKPHEVASQFLRYVQTFQAAPSDRLVIGYNSWTSLMPPTEKNCLRTIGLLRRKLYEPYGVALDFFALDDGWDNKDSLWNIRKEGFPHGFAPLVEALRPMKTRLGLWLSPSSGYGHAAWGARHGFGVNASYDWFLCQSDPKYRHDMAQVVIDLQRRYDLGFFKLDGFMACCDTDQHPWHLNGDFAREANVDAVEGLFSAMRQANHSVWLDPTSGMWLSPWWLKTADSFWADTYDGQAPAVAPAPDFPESSITSRDAQFRLRCRQNPWFPSYALETLDIYQPNAPLDDNGVMATLARGQRLVNLYADLRRFSDADWHFLAAAFRWARHNAGTLCHTVELPGDPLEGEAYGLAHFHSRRGILSVRNPSYRPQRIRVRLDTSSGWLPQEALSVSAKNRFLASVVYPRQETLATPLHYGDTLELELQPYEQMVVQIEPEEDLWPRLCGVRAREVSRQDKRITWEVCGPAGEEIQGILRATNEPTRILLNGQPVHGIVKIDDGWQIPLAFTGRKPTCTLAGAFSVRPGDGSRRLTGRWRAVVSKGTQAAFVVLCRAKTDLTGSLQCAASVNQRPVSLRSFGPQLHLPHHLFYREFGRQYWKWFQFELSAGARDIAIVITGPANQPAPAPLDISASLQAQEPLQRASLTMEFSHRLTTTETDPLPVPVAQVTRHFTVVVSGRGH